MASRTDRIGECRISNQGYKMEVVEYINANNMIVRFDDGSTKKVAWKEFNKGSIEHPNHIEHGYKKDLRLGEENINNQGCHMKIIQYNSANDILIQFDNDPTHIDRSAYQRFKNGNAQNPFYPTVYGIGITGNEAPRMNGKDKLKEYRAWVRIIERCVKGASSPKCLTYEDCSVSEDFLYYPNFYNWIINQENYEVWKTTENFAVDKDIICKGNKIYCPDKCCLVPNNINNLIKPASARRGNCVIGVFLDNKNRYVAQCWNGLESRNVFLGKYDKEYDAFLAYKDYKEKLIKKTADLEYSKGTISTACREALHNYIVEITD